MSRVVTMKSWVGLLLTLLMMIILDLCCSSDEDPPGHMKPFGSHQPPDRIITIDHLPAPPLFFQNHVKWGQPLLMKGVAQKIPAFSKWTDEYLSTNFGAMNVTVETVKKEIRSEERQFLRLDEFLTKYQKSELYMVQAIFQSNGMLGDLSLLRPLMCGGFQKVLQEAYVWMSSGGTSSVLHSDDVDNINCLIDGEKEFFIVDFIYADQVENDGFEAQGAYSQVDVDKVDMYKFPELGKVPWVYAKMEKGDCLYIPRRWYHQVRSSGSRNIASNLWFAYLVHFDEDDCLEGPRENYKPLSEYSLAGPIEQMRSELLWPFENLESVSLSEAIDAWEFEFDVSKDEIKKLFNLIDSDGNGDLSWTEMYDVDIMDVARKFPKMVDSYMARRIKDHYKTDSQDSSPTKHDEL